MRKPFLLVLTLAIAIASKAHAEEFGPSCPELEVAFTINKKAMLTFLEALKKAANANDAKAIAALISYPLRVNVGVKGKPLAKAKRETIKNASDLNKKFSSVFTEKVMNAIRSQAIENIFCRDQGAMIGDGEIWIKETRAGKIGVAVVNTER